MPEKIVVCGAGLVGSLLSVYLAKKGHDVEIYERRSDPRLATQDSGRSINLALSDRGLRALAGVNLAEKVKTEYAIPMYRRVMHDKQGNLTYQPYGKENQAINSVSRSKLNQMLMDEAEENGVKIKFGQKCSTVNLKEPHVVFEDCQTGELERVGANLIFGADGAFSGVRTAMQKTDRFNYSQKFIDHGYKELTIQSGPNGEFLIEREALHIWPRGSHMLIALPNPDGSFTCTLFFPFEGNSSFSSLDTTEKARRFFEEEFSDVLPLMKDFDKEWEQNPASSMVIISCYPWTRNGKVALIGDSSHAIVPFYGQGMNSGFEDCTVLNELIEKHGDNWDLIFREYEQSRKPDTDAISELALRNFVEMRDLTGDPDFLLRKKIERKFSDKYPQKWVPLYSLVTFSDHVRYSEALDLGKKQDKIMEQIMSLPDIHEKWDTEEVEEAMLNLVES